MKQKIIIIGLIGAAMIFAGYWGLGWYSLNQVNDFQSCSESRGNVIMESFPEQCRTRDGRVFPDIDQGGEEPKVIITEITYEEALAIAQKSECTEKGVLANTYLYNDGTKTWWIDLDIKNEFKKDGCSPVCVIGEKDSTAEINWRCTGLVVPE